MTIQKLPELLEDHKYLVMEDALYFEDMEHNFYHQCPGLSSSTIRRFMVSQSHALEETVQDSAALRFGSAAHSLIVEGEDAFNKDVACLIGSPYTTQNKDLKREYEGRGLTVINNKDRETIHAMNKALLPEGVKLLKPNEGEYPGIFNSPYERAIFWWEKDVLLKVKSDVLRHPIQTPYGNNSIILVDYKTTQDCSIQGFTSSVKKYSYDLQASWYKRAYEAAGFKVVDFYFVAQEKKVPYASKIFKLSEYDLNAGWGALEGALIQYKDVIEGNEKPSVYNSPDSIELKIRNPKNV
tara:strand:+ start:3033 stop:3920 length:888 start_codon:yes stop_codon:yes gene_type:complete